MSFNLVAEISKVNVLQGAEVGVSNNWTPSYLGLGRGLKLLILNENQAERESPAVPSDFGCGLEEIVDLPVGRLGGIRAVDGVALDGEAVEPPEGPRFGLGRVRGAHDLAPAGDGVLGLEHHDDDRARGHEAGQVLVELLVLVDDVEPLGLVPAEVEHLHGRDGEPLVLDLLEDAADEPLLGGVGLDDGQGPQGHDCVSFEAGFQTDIPERSGGVNPGRKDRFDRPATAPLQ